MVAETHKRDLTREELELLIEMSRRVSSSLDLDEILRFAVQSTREICRCEASSILLRDEKTGELVFRTAEGGEDLRVKEIRLSPGQGIAGHVVMTGEPLLVEDAYNSPYFSDAVDADTGFTTRSMICVPLWGPEERIIGCLEVINHLDNRPFSLEEVRLCEAVAAQAAIAIYNARLCNEKIESERLACIGRSIMGVAHCVKNILNGIEGGGYILERGIAEAEMETVRKGWDMLQRHKSRLKDLVMDMLYVSKSREIDLAPTDLGKILKEVFEIARPPAEEFGVHLEIDIAEDLPAALADGNTFFRCILNLVINAIEACRDVQDGCVTIALHVDDSGRRVNCVISDSGPGFPPEIAEHPFVPFQSTKGSKGTGLGLYTARQMIESIGGSIGIENKPEGGATVFVSLCCFESVAAETLMEDLNG